jgi:hypothetical protein
VKLSDSRGFLILSGLSRRDRRAVLFGAAVLVPAALYVLGVKPYLGALDEVRTRTAAEQDLLTREMELMGRASALPGQIQEAQASAAIFEERIVRAASGELAEGEITEFLETSAVRSRVLLEEIRGGEFGRGEEPPPGLAVIRLHLRGESDLEGILTFLDELENSPLLLRVRGLALEPEMARPESDNEEGTRGPAVPTGVVGLQLIVDGFARVEEFGS